jgi:hypothetical protein
MVPSHRYAGSDLFCEPDGDETTLYCECCSDVYDDCSCEHDWDEFCPTCVCCGEAELECRCGHGLNDFCDSECDE